MVSITDKFGKASANDSYAEATTVKTARLAGESVLLTFDLGAFDADAPLFFLTYRKEIDPDTDEVTIVNQTGWKGLVDKDTNSITNLTLAPGYTDVGNGVGDYVEAVPTSFWANELVDGISVSHNPDGKLKPTAVDTAISEGDRWKETFHNYIAPGTGNIAVVAGLTVSISSIVYYIDGVRYVRTSIPNKTLAASRDTYCFIEKVTGAITYIEAANGGATPATPADSVIFAVIISGASSVSNIIYRNRNEWKSYTPTLTPTVGTMNLTSIVMGQCVYREVNGMTEIFVRVASFTISGSPLGGEIQVSLPIKSYNERMNLAGVIVASSASEVGLVYGDAADSTRANVRRADSSVWATGSNKTIIFTGSYRSQA